MSQSFSHLHCHTQYSLLDGATDIKAMIAKAKADQMPGVAITDHGNMFGVFNFVNEAHKAGIKPIIGCELYLVEDRHKRKFTKQNKDKRYHQLMLAKNAEGYKNLSILCSLGYKEGLYSKYPRVDKALIAKYNKGLIATSCCIGAEIPQTILFQGEQAAERKLKWWLDIFGKEDYYIELQRHQIENIDETGLSQEDVNQVLLKLAQKYDLKVIATNDSHYLDEDDSEIHDILLCINTGEKKSTPIGRGKGKRFGFPNSAFYFKTQHEMNRLFADVPQALDYTNEIVGKIEPLNLKRDVLLPAFPLPSNFVDQNAYLKHLAFEGAKWRYDTLTPELTQRLDHELNIIKNMGFPGYFLIVQDFIRAAKERHVIVGPGRGSAAGSVVAYCIGITNIDPIAYNLLFERFLNPERVSMPDIDIDFDDEGRQQVIDYVVDKYGKNQVAQIITYGHMAAKLSIRDVARVLDVPLKDSIYLTKLVPNKANTKLKDAFEQIPELNNLYNRSNSITSRVLQQAETLEGSVRNTGIHAAGIIIAPDNIMHYLPVCTSKETDLDITQFDGKIIEDAGMLKMDFLGLKTLSIIRTAIQLIEDTKGEKIDINQISYDDSKTFDLYQAGQTIGTFQFESEGMRVYLKDLKPTNIEDLIAMNALYRPGPIQFIPNYIDRKNKKEKVEYLHPILEPILKPTFGIMIYQEQIMQTAQVMAGYTLGQADLLRRAMGKKKIEEMKKQRTIFIKGAKSQHQIESKVAEKIFSIMEKFAEYGFNRSHSAAYSVVAYQTAYLKANYPTEYMAAVLNHNMDDLDSIRKFIAETQNMAIKILGPDINESSMNFSINEKGKIRFGLSAVKGVGRTASENIILERQKQGFFKNIYDLFERVSPSDLTKGLFESLTKAGAFDNFDTSRAQLLKDSDNLKKLFKYGQYCQEKLQRKTTSLFGAKVEQNLSRPRLNLVESYSKSEVLNHEKEVTGFFISGHPLDKFKYFIHKKCKAIKDIDLAKDRYLKLAGIITKVKTYLDNNKTSGNLELEDFDSKMLIRFNDSIYQRYTSLIQEGQRVIIQGEVRIWRSNKGYSFDPHKITDLENLTDQAQVSITLSLDLKSFNDQHALDLIELFKTHPGQTQVYLDIFNPDRDRPHNFLVSKYKVNLENGLLDGLKAVGVTF